jgi:hypothetical protein
MVKIINNKIKVKFINKLPKIVLNIRVVKNRNTSLSGILVLVKILFILAIIFWLRGTDLNRRPSGYEPDELPDCSTPRYN